MTPLRAHHEPVDDESWSDLLDELTAPDPTWDELEAPSEPAWGFDDPEAL